MTEKQQNISRGSIFYLLLCFGGIVAFCLVSIIPNQRSMQAMDNEIKELMHRIDKQKILFPAYQQLWQEIETKEVRTLPFPEAAPLGRAKIDTLTSVFGEIARRHNMNVDIVPEVKSISSDSELLLANLTVQGDFFLFRNFLVELGALPYVRQIEEIKIYTIPGNLEYSLKCWIFLGLE